jgi:hypothetical protein
MPWVPLPMFADAFRVGNQRRATTPDCRADPNWSIIRIRSLRENEMQNKLVVVVIGLAASAVFAAAVQFQPLNVSTGLWHITKAVTWTNLPPQMAAMMKAAPQMTSYNSCVTTQSLSSNPWANGSGDTCTWTVLTSTSTDMEVQGAGCDFGGSSGMTGTVHGTIHIVDPQHGTGTMAVSLSGNGQSMQGTATYTGQWVSATCPAH